jgi:hypothetical protein
MNRFLLIASLVLTATAAAPAQAADKLSYPASVVGTWCQIETEHEVDGWSFFSRRCVADEDPVMVILSKNGDYTMVAEEWIYQRCKADPKSYFKGWTDYTCTDKQGTTTRHNAKWVIQGRNLGLSKTEY